MSAHDAAAWSELTSDAVVRLISASDDELDGVVHETLANMAELCDAERSYITFYDAAAGTFDISHEWTQGVVRQRAAIQHVGLDRFPWSVGLANRGELMVVDDIDDLPPEADPERQSFGAFAVRSILQVPIVHNGTTVGIAGLNRFRPNPGWDPLLVEFVRRTGQAIGVALVRQRAMLDVAAAQARADEARRSRDELLAHVSHELRTPLHAILGYAELLELDDRSEHDREALMRIQTNGRQLLGMIDDLVALARSSGDDRDAHVELAHEVAQTVVDLGPVAAERGLALRAAPIEGVAAVEAGRLRQVARCLVIGAVQSMRDGSIVMGAGASPGSATVWVDLTSDAPIGRDGLVLPIAEMLIQGHGMLTVEPGHGDQAHAATRVTATFATGRPARG